MRLRKKNKLVLIVYSLTPESGIKKINDSNLFILIPT